jgi:hypothetical protein
MLNVLGELKVIETSEENMAESAQFIEQIKQIESFTQSADRMFSKVASSDENWFWKILMKLMR